jgi:hypothetical protein
MRHLLMAGDLRPISVARVEAKRDRGRSRTQDQNAQIGQKLRKEHPELSWAQTAKKVDPEGFSRDQKGTTDRIRLAITYRERKTE